VKATRPFLRVLKRGIRVKGEGSFAVDGHAAKGLAVIRGVRPKVSVPCVSAKTSTRLEDLIDLPPSVAHILRPWQPTLAYHLLELVRIPYGAFAGTPEGILTLRALKAEPMNELLEDVIWDESLLFSISESALERILRYVLNADVSIP
jgi:hypothetical protein